MAFKRSRVRSSPSPPKNLVLRNEIFLSIAKAMVYHRRQAYIITRSVHIINRRLHNRFRNDDIQRLPPLIILNSCGIDDMHGFAVIFARFQSGCFCFYGGGLLKCLNVYGTIQ